MDWTDAGRRFAHIGLNEARLMDGRAGPRASVTLDLTGTSCPGPILGATKLIAQLGDGEVLLLISDCPATGDDLFAWAERTGNQVLLSERLPTGATAYFVRRGHADEPVAHASLDVRGSVCPAPVIEANRTLGEMSGGELLRLITDCPGARADVGDWVRITGARLEDVVELGPPTLEFFIRKP